MTWKQPERLPSDGPITATRLGHGLLYVTVETEGDKAEVVMSEYNATRVFAALALLLEIPLHKTAAKEIKL